MEMPIKRSAKAVILNPETMEVLVLRRIPQDRRERSPEGWDWPGGAVEPDEEIVIGLLREVREETGLVEVSVLGEFGREQEPKNGRMRLFFKFLLLYKEGEIVLAPDEHDYYQWVCIRQIEKTELLSFPTWMIKDIEGALQLYIRLHS